MIVTTDKLLLDNQLLRIDGFAPCKVIVEDGIIYLEFLDRDRLRSRCRGDHLLKISLEELTLKIKELANHIGE